MVQSQFKSSGQHRGIVRLGRSALLQRHPVLLPVLLLICATALATASFFADGLFPVLKFIGVPSPLLCLLLAYVLGISGILTSIIGIIECMDRYSLQNAMFPKSKEQSYANRN
jgi:hypothetical protein